MRRETDF